MSFALKYDAILTQFKTGMDTLRPNVPIAYPNMPFDPDTQYIASTHEAWARIVIQGGEERQASIGGDATRWRKVGIVSVQVFTPLNAGQTTALEISDDVATTLRGITVSGVILKAATINPIGREDDEAWLQVNIDVPFRYDYTV